MPRRSSNPNKANQYRPDPRQVLFLAAYLDPKSSTFSNATQSALAAGYTQEYADNITSQMPTWLAESLGDDHRVALAEKNLNEFLLIDKDDAAFQRIKADMTKFTLERLRKDKYAARKEVTGKDGKDFDFKQKTDEELMDLLKNE